jgi:hypothetical protein
MSWELGDGAFYFSIWGLRVSRIVDLRRVSGSKSGAFTRAKNCEAFYSNEQEKAS